METFAYADDLAIHAFDQSKLIDAISIVEQWVEKNKMKINKKKSGIIVHKKRHRKNKKDVKEDVEGFPIVERYKYLGIWLDSSMNYEYQLEEMRKKIEKSMKIINIMKWKKLAWWRVTYL